MSTGFGRAAIIVVLLLAIVGVLYLKGQQAHETASTPEAPLSTQSEGNGSPVSPVSTPPTSPSPVKPAPAPKTVAPAVTPPEKPTADTTRPPVKPRPTPPATKATAPAPAIPAKLPRLLELGADKCVPCKMMQPVLEELRKEYADKLQVDFIDVWKDPAAGEPYNVQGIPTQIFFDADGKELFRHSGFYPKDDIVAKFAELGIAL